MTTEPALPEQTCACGSGLRAVRCCELPRDLLARLVPREPLAPLLEQARAALAQGDRTRAGALLFQILEQAPAHTEALILLCEIRADEGRPAAVEALLRRIVAIEPNHFGAINELCLLLLRKGAVLEAVEHARNAIRVAPEEPQAHNLMGMAFTEAHRADAGEYHYRKVLELLPERDPVTLANLAWNLKQQGRIEEARPLYEEATAGNSDLQTWLGWARTEEADRRLDRALELLGQAERVSPGNSSVALSRAVVFGRQGDYPRALRELDSLAKTSGALGPEELLEKGRLLDRIGRYDEAWASFAEAKRTLREGGGLVYADEAAAHTIGRLKNFFVAPRLRLLPRAVARSGMPQPIFIVGFPRSGTTLVEQSLSAHPHIAAGDELPFIHEIAGSMVRTLSSPLSYPEALAELWMGDRRDRLDTLSGEYLDGAMRRGVVKPGATRFTDKMPLNETHLGLIALLFPQAPIIHLVRHPLDVTVSVFSQLLTHGFNCAFALESIALHYRRIMELVAHYRNEMPLRYLQVRYEDIVADHPGNIRKILEFVGEEPHPACLNFHENRRYARTASYAQVTEPLYERSRYRHLNYRRHLQPAVDILEPVIHELGYGVGVAGLRTDA